MNSKYRSYINNLTCKKIVCGTYRCHRQYFPKSLPFLEKEIEWHVPLKMFKQGLLVVGDPSRKTRRQFTNNYVKSLITNDVKVIYITDQNLRGYQGHLEPLRGLFDVKDGLCKKDVEFCSLTADCNSKLFESDVRLQIFQPEWEVATKGVVDTHYNSSLICLLNAIAEADLSSFSLGTRTQEVVVVLNEGYCVDKSNSGELEKAICWLRGKGVGVVISCNNSSRFKGVLGSFGHYIFTGLLDPSEEIELHDFFHVESVTDDNSLHSPRVNVRDLMSHRGNECHHIVRGVNGEDCFLCVANFKSE
ncbi:hypothetical protein [Vibrio sp. D431a]|uniref:hypothetical protein n=1 Tax=Vibrio sp. D431a TaxID=2837388 RepID=UPI0025526020|nr:hypothetical protein [Vibrio sp. D431a]MDK9789993.1 hypothetical protein [Vibrio sp. D431a]